jgi:hypothetical protein
VAGSLPMLCHLRAKRVLGSRCYERRRVTFLQDFLRSLTGEVVSGRVVVCVMWSYLLLAVQVWSDRWQQPCTGEPLVVFSLLV